MSRREAVEKAAEQYGGSMRLVENEIGAFLGRTYASVTFGCISVAVLCRSTFLNLFHDAIFEQPVDDFDTPVTLVVDITEGNPR